MAISNFRQNVDVEGQYIRNVEGQPTSGSVVCKPLIAGEEMTLLEIRYAAGAGPRTHAHQHETLCYVVSGKVRTWVGDEEFVLGPGDTCRHPAGIGHGIQGIAEESIVIEIKAPAQPVAEFLGMSPT